MKKIFNNKKILYSVLGIVLLFVIGGSFIAGYYLAKSETETKLSKQYDKKTKDALQELQKLVDNNINKNNNNTIGNVEQKTTIDKKKGIKDNNLTIVKETHNKEMISSEALDYLENSKSNLNELNNSNQTTKTEIIYTNKPKLVIIMDDLSFGYQVKELKKLNMKITPSFFPPSKRHPNTPLYAKQFKHYMVHFPMQATNSHFREEENTLHIDSSYQFIENRVKEIKKWFPQDKFVNNHTGSKFTADLNSMKKLYKIIDKYGLIFVDSRTTAKTKAPLLAKKYNQILLSRDVFLDNKADVKYVLKQLKLSVKKAKKHGYAIAICHPHSKTFEALKEGKNILKGVELIYIDELYNLAKTDKISRL